ncbi:hypothetical protein BDN67DRAFT_972696 [Paxillus ammoniavirescens]|nr:hypothetical protein BDN67DRAFT_972696 [Paxillus ammoniavirescens]
MKPTDPDTFCRPDNPDAVRRTCTHTGNEVCTNRSVLILGCCSDVPHRDASQSTSMGNVVQQNFSIFDSDPDVTVCCRTVRLLGRSFPPLVAPF